MSAPGLSMHPGVTIGPGVTLAAVVAAGFTLSPNDVYASISTGTSISDLGSGNGFSSVGGFNLTVANYEISRSTMNSPKLTEILAYFSGYSLDNSSGSYGYVFDVIGQSGSNISKVLIAIDSGNIIIAPVTTGNPDWANTGLSNIALTSPNGTLIFPATFTLISPTIAHSSVGWY
jgi:hypothetical protein